MRDGPRQHLTRTAEDLFIYHDIQIDLSMLQQRLRESVPGYKELKLKLPASSPEELKLRKSIRDKEYKSSEKGRAKQKEYRSSEQGQAKQKEYMSSEKGQAHRKEAETRYRSSEKGQATTKAYQESAEGKATLLKAQLKTKSKPGFKASTRKIARKYSATPKGKATRARYLASENGLRSIALATARRHFKKSKTVDDNFELVDGKIQHAR